MTEYKLNIQKSIPSRNTNRKHAEKEIKKTTSFTITSEKKSSNKFNLELKNSNTKTFKHQKETLKKILEVERLLIPKTW